MGQRAVKALLSVPMVSGASKLGTRRMPQLGNSLLPNCRVVAGLPADQECGVFREPFFGPEASCGKQPQLEASCRHVFGVRTDHRWIYRQQAWGNLFGGSQITGQLVGASTNLRRLLDPIEAIAGRSGGRFAAAINVIQSQIQRRRAFIHFA